MFEVFLFIVEFAGVAFWRFDSRILKQKQKHIRRTMDAMMTGATHVDGEGPVGHGVHIIEISSMAMSPRPPPARVTTKDIVNDWLFFLSTSASPRIHFFPWSPSISHSDRL